MDEGVSFATIDFDGGEQFQPLRRALGVTSIGMNLISFRRGSGCGSTATTGRRRCTWCCAAC